MPFFAFIPNISQGTAQQLPSFVVAVETRGISWCDYNMEYFKCNSNRVSILTYTLRGDGSKAGYSCA